MIIIDKPYVSDFLITTIKENNIQIISTTNAREMIKDESLSWISEKEARYIFDNNPETRVYTNSENSISWIEKNFSSSNLPTQINIFKNKIKFRELIKDSFPDYFFLGTKYGDLRKIVIEEIKFPFIIKPAVGFFSLAVHKVDDIHQWNRVLDKIETEIEQLKGIYPKEVVDITDFIFEEYIEGEEYAIDCYYDEKGEPVILNILHHIFSSESDVSDRIYSTSKEIMEKYSSVIQDFLITIGAKTKLRNFPAHVEVRISSNGKIVPIEVNPLRYGGLCTTGDISWYAYGINSYRYFLENKKPDWKDIFSTREDSKYSIIVLNNNSGFDENEIDYFDYDLLLNDFKKPMSLRKIDFKKYLVFGFLFIETTVGKEEELNQILSSDLRKYIKLKK
jgi:hypothetical protein